MYLNKISLVPNLDVINTPKPITGANALSIPLQQKYPFALSYKDDLWGVATIGPKTPFYKASATIPQLLFYIYLNLDAIGILPWTLVLSHCPWS